MAVSIPIRVMVQPFQCGNSPFYMYGILKMGFYAWYNICLI